MLVSALVLTVGEPYLKRCLLSVDNQTRKFDDVVIIKGEKPWDAVNKGVREIVTEFYVQVDCDFILNKNCCEVLLKEMIKQDEKCFSVFASLFDSFLGQIQAVKIFRTELVRQNKYRRSYTCDRDFYATMPKKGYHYKFLPEFLATHDPYWSQEFIKKTFLTRGQRAISEKEQDFYYSRISQSKASEHNKKLAIKSYKEGLKRRRLKKK